MNAIISGEISFIKGVRQLRWKYRLLELKLSAYKAQIRIFSQSHLYSAPTEGHTNKCGKKPKSGHNPAYKSCQSKV